MEKVAIIGAGITGGSIARLLSKYENLEIHLFEKEPDVSWGATKANTGIIHPGHEDDSKEYPLRAKLCVRGNRIWHEWVEELDIPVEWPGELMVARSEEDFENLREYKKIGKKNGVSGLRIIRKDELQEMEPNLTSEAIGALWAPTAGRIEPWEAVIGLVENAVDNGVKPHLNTKVLDIHVKKRRIRGIKTRERTFEADVVINAAGLFADEISKMTDAEEFTIRPRKGEYYLFNEDIKPKVEKIIHPTPTQKTKGVYVTQTVEGNLMLGPTAEDLPANEKDERSTTHEGLDFVWEQSKRLVRTLPSKKKITKTFAGLRPEPPEGKYIIKSYDDPAGFVNVAGIRSPGLTAAPAIANFVRDLLENKIDIQLVEKGDWNPIRKGIERFSEKPFQKKQELIEKDSRYGNVVCMCKEVTEAEILEAIRRMKKIGGDEVTLDSLKFRTLAMFGSCQGTFCKLELARILSRELDVPLWKVTKAGEETEYGIGDVKTLLRGEERDTHD